MSKICFFQSEISHEQLLKTFSKMTPGRRGYWRDLEGTTNPEIADFHIVIDETAFAVDPKKTIYVGGHPTSCTGYSNFENRGGYVAKLDIAETFGFGEWWLREDYDTLSAMQPMKKTKNLSCILSDTRVFDYHKDRIKFMANFCKKYPKEVDLYGRIMPRDDEQSLYNSYNGVAGIASTSQNYYKAYWFGKRPALEPYRYSLEFDMGRSPQIRKCENYFSERLFDSMLMWCMPIYYGGTNIEKYLSINSFRYFDLYNLNHTPEYILGIIRSDFREQQLKDLAETRDLLLNKYQIWARIHEIIHNL
jgi:hypothetical protein